MKILVKILVGIAALIVLLLIVALFVKKEYSVEKEIIIKRPRQEVFDYVKLLKNQDNYSVWVRLDPHMKKEFRGTDGTIGFVYAWDSKDKNAGKGEQEIIKKIEGERIDVEVRFEKPFKGIAYAPIILETVSENQTRVKWGMNGKSTYPMNFMNLFMGSMLGNPVEESLKMVKVNLEK